MGENSTGELMYLGQVLEYLGQELLYLGTPTPPEPPAPNCADPLERCAFAVPGESGRSRFRRLYALGYV